MKRTSKEDYLRCIYFLYERSKNSNNNDAGIKSVDLSKELNVTKPSVSEMIKKLSSKGYVEAKPYSNIFLTKKGFNEAKKVMHNHRVIEVFLKNVLKYEINKPHKKSKIHEEAHKLEHAFSEESIKRLDSFLKDPKKSPYGKEIPHDNSIRNKRRN